MSPRRRRSGRPTASLPPEAERLLDIALTEDRVRRDRTTRAVLPAAYPGQARVSAQAAGILSGNRAAAELARKAGIRVMRELPDGRRIRRGTVVLELRGDARRILGAERALLNLLMHLSGVATATRRAVEAAAGRIEVRGTRKTLPGLRDLEKAAIVHGGGAPHRRDLSEGILVKNNHLALVPLDEAIRRLRARPGRHPTIEVEVRSPAEAVRAVGSGAEELLLDNLSPAQARRTILAVRRAPGGRRIPIEVSGGITPRNLGAYAATGADSASLGSLTHSAPALPFHLTLRPSR